MTIGTNDGILKFGTQDEVTSGTPATIADDAYGKADQGSSVNWTNDDDALDGSAVLKCQFDGTMPTVGNIWLLAHLQNIEGTNDTGVPDVNYPEFIVGTFPIDFGVAADVDFYTPVIKFEMPSMGPAQRIDWYLKNNGTQQTIGVSWQLWITPTSVGPHA